MARNNYFNSLTMAQKLDQLGRCRFMARDEFQNGSEKIKGRKIVIIGCGALARELLTLTAGIPGVRVEGVDARLHMRP